MPTIITHAALPLTLGLGLGRQAIPRGLLLAGIALAVLPDLDVIAFRLGISYATEFGHRGFSHSFLFAAMIAFAVAFAATKAGIGFFRAFMFLFVAAVSHGILDAFTTGGLGIAFLWPFSPERYFAPIQVIRVSPISAAHIFSPRMIAVLRSEAWWVWIPFLTMMASLVVFRWAIGFKSALAKRAPTGPEDERCGPD